MSKKVKNMRALVFDNDHGVLRMQTVTETLANTIELEDGVYETKDTTKYIDDMSGMIYFVINAPQTAQVEAQNLKSLRRSTAIQNMLEFDRAKPLDIFKLMPYFIIVMLIVFG